MESTIIWHDEKRKVAELIPAEYNPRNLTEAQATQLRTSLKRFGLAEPVVINTSNVVIGGHQRLKMLALDGVVDVDVRVPNRLLNESEEKELNVRLNKNTGGWDYDALANNFDNDALQEWGFSPQELGLEPNAKIDTDNINDSLDSYLEGNVKQVVLYFKADEYNGIVDRLEKLVHENNLENYTDMFKIMLEYYENHRIAQ